MITHEMISEGIMNGTVRIEPSPNGDSLVCSIGANWFYFGQSINIEDYSNPYKFVKEVPLDEICDAIFKTIESFRTSGMEEFEDEYKYYDTYMNEQLTNNN